jgi:CRISPR-associated protein Csb2
MLTTARYQLEGSNRPPVRATLPLAEAARRAIMSRYRRVKEFDRYGKDVPPHAERFASPVFSGKDEDGHPIRGDHEHAFYLPTDEDGDGMIDHLTVFAQGGFPRDEVRALDTFRWLRFGDLELSLLLVGLGQVEQFRHAPALDVARVWSSATPFVVTRHLKRRGQKRDPREFFESPDGREEFVKHVLRDELSRRSLGANQVDVECVKSVGEPPASEFCLRRQKPNDDGPNRPRGYFRITFAEPVSGPIALGHSCHFGLGLFVAERNGELGPH